MLNTTEIVCFNCAGDCRVNIKIQHLEADFKRSLPSDICPDIIIMMNKTKDKCYVLKNDCHVTKSLNTPEVLNTALAAVQNPFLNTYSNFVRPVN